MALSKARRAFNALRILYPAISKRVNTNDSYPAVELAECARCLMDASGNIIVAADNLATLNASTVTLAGAISVADPTTPSVSLATGKTNTGFFLVYGKTSGSLKITTADATAQAITINGAAQTSGAVTLTIPDFAGVNDTLVFTTLAATLSNKTFVAPVLGVATGTSLAVTGLIKSSSATAGIGYATGAQGTAVAQATDRTTTVICSGMCGQITTQATSLAAQTSVAFTVTNTAVVATDTVIVNVRSGPTGLKTIATVTTVAAGSFQVNLFNTDAATADTGAAILNFSVIRAVAA